MESFINQIVAILILSATVIFFIYCAIIKEAPSIEIVRKICTSSLLIVIAIILILLPFYPNLFDWLRQAVIPLTIVGVLMFTLVIQPFWSKDS